MPSFVRLLCLVLCVGCTLPAFAMEDTPQNREQEANRYLQAVPPEAVVSDISKRMSASLPQDQQAAFLAAMHKDVNLGAINDASRAALVKVFTPDELKALADFYSQPVTKGAMEKMGTYMADVMPTVAKEVRAAATKAAQEVAPQTSQQK
ncbi:MAG: DUF2059 domain-containing protein [Rhodomicrobium sp.]